MTIYYTDWLMEFEAESPEDAAEQARQEMMKPDTPCTIFRVESAKTGDVFDVDTSMAMIMEGAQ